MKKWILQLTLLTMLPAGHVVAKGEEVVEGWNVWWSDANENGHTIGYISKRDWIEDHDGMSQIAMGIEQHDNNHVQITAWFKYPDASPSCDESITENEVNAKVNLQPIKMIMITRQSNACVNFVTWIGKSDVGRKLLRDALNSGAINFEFGVFDYVYDTTNNLAAYKLMRKMTGNETRATKTGRKGGPIDLNENPDYKRSLSIIEYDEMLINDFDTWHKIGFPREIATVILKKHGSKETMFSAELNIDANGKKSIFFRSSCSMETDVNLADVMSVNGTNIQVVSGCSKASSGPLTQLYMPKTSAGNEFLIEQFRSKEYVRAKLDGMILPFSTNGFAAAWDRLGDAPL